MSPSLQDDLVSIVVRTVNPERLPLLREAITSIYENSYRPVETIIVAQTDNNQYMQAIKTLISEYQDPEFLIQLVTNHTQQDQRARNLNLGIAVARGRFVGFLDDDDLFYPNHITALIEPLRSADLDWAWAYGDVALAQCFLDQAGQLHKTLEFPFKHEAFSLADFFRENSIPIHAYLLDRIKIDPELLMFDESFTLGEDYVFLLKIAARYLPLYVKTPVSEYRVFDDLSNSNVIMNDQLGQPNRAKIKAWSHALWRTEILKENLMPGYGSGLLSLKLRKYIFYQFPDLKIFLQSRMPNLRQAIFNTAKTIGLVK